MNKIILPLLTVFLVLSCNTFSNDPGDLPAETATAEDIIITEIEVHTSTQQGDTTPVSVVLRNTGEGVFTDTLAVTLFDQTDSLAIGTRVLSDTLNPGGTSTLGYSWNTGSASVGEHVLSAVYEGLDHLNGEETPTATVSVLDPDDGFDVDDDEDFGSGGGSEDDDKASDGDSGGSAEGDDESGNPDGDTDDSDDGDDRDDDGDQNQNGDDRGSDGDGDHNDTDGDSDTSSEGDSGSGSDSDSGSDGDEERSDSGSDNDSGSDADADVNDSSSDSSSSLEVESISPDRLRAGRSVTVTIRGSGFSDRVSISFENGNGPAPSASRIRVFRDNRIIARITARSGGPPRDRPWDVIITNNDGSSTVIEDGFTVFRNN